MLHELPVLRVSNLEKSIKFWKPILEAAGYGVSDNCVGYQYFGNQGQGTTFGFVQRQRSSIKSLQRPVEYLLRFVGKEHNELKEVRAIFIRLSTIQEI
jgi:hypothetical protein